jgi:hypothetical protein
MLPVHDVKQVRTVIKELCLVEGLDKLSWLKLHGLRQNDGCILSPISQTCLRANIMLVKLEQQPTLSPVLPRGFNRSIHYCVWDTVFLCVSNAESYEKMGHNLLVRKTTTTINYV